MAAHHTAANENAPSAAREAVRSVIALADGEVDIDLAFDFEGGQECPRNDRPLHRCCPIEAPEFESVRGAVDSILRLGGGANDGRAARAAAAAAEALMCYEDIVRPAVVERFSPVGEDEWNSPRDVGSAAGLTDDGANVVPGGRAAVRRYETLLSELLAASEGTTADAVSVTGADVENRKESDCYNGGSKGRGGESLEREVRDDNRARDRPGPRTARSLCSSIRAVSVDVIALTASKALTNASDAEDRDESSSADNSRRLGVRGVVLPTLLRVLTFAVQVLGAHLRAGSARTRGGGRIRTADLSLDAEVRESLSVAIVVAAAFVPGDDAGQVPGRADAALGPISIHPPLAWDLCLSHAASSCAYPPVPGSSWDRLVAENGSGDVGKVGSFLQQPVVDLQCVCKPSPWMDGSTEVGWRVATKMLGAVLDSASALPASDHWGTTGGGKDKDWSLLRRAANLVGAEKVAKVSRAHFFGRLTEQMQSGCMIDEGSITSHVSEANGDKTTISTTRRPWYCSRSLPQDHPSRIPDYLPHNLVPSRVHSSLRLLSSFRFPDVTDSVLSEFLPICYTLIDCYDSAHQAIGGAALLHLMRESTPTSFRPYKDAAMNVLELGCRACRHAPALAVLCRARVALFEGSAALVGKLDQSPSSAAPRRKATSDLLSLLRVQNGDDKPLLAGMLVGGVGFLLAQHADLPNADAMELLRPGLAALLPLVRWDSTSASSRAVQLAALVGLTSLLMGAHPLVPRHGGKIMSELLACLGRVERDLAIGEKIVGETNVPSSNHIDNRGAAEAVSALALHVSCVALVLCRDRAEAVLRTAEGGRYDPSLARWCKKIREGARELLMVEEGTNGSLQCGHSESEHLATSD